MEWSRGAQILQIRDINHLFPGRSQRFYALRLLMETQRQDPHPNQV